jgi:hypothetical protein
MMADTTCKKKPKQKILILTGVFCTVGGTLVTFEPTKFKRVCWLPPASMTLFFFGGIFLT